MHAPLSLRPLRQRKTEGHRAKQIAGSVFGVDPVTGRARRHYVWLRVVG